jgi:hypothetical protein
LLLLLALLNMLLTFQTFLQVLRSEPQVLLRRGGDESCDHSNTPLISRQPKPFSGDEEEEEDDDDDSSGGRRRRRRRDDAKSKSGKQGRLVKGADQSEEEEEGEEEEELHPDMEFCDPCYCYGKCCMDVVASIFCVSLL